MESQLKYILSMANYYARLKTDIAVTQLQQLQKPKCQKSLTILSDCYVIAVQ